MQSTSEQTPSTDAMFRKALAASYATLNGLHFHGALRTPVLELVDLPGRLGQWSPQGRTLSIAHRLVREHSWGVVQEILKHEMAHQYVTEVLQVADESAHGPVFRRVCERLRIDASASGLPEVDAAPPKILERVRRLLALAESTNRHEAESAMSNAQRLMLKYNLELEPTRSRYAFREIGVVRARTPAHERILSGILTQHFFVEAVWVPSIERETGASGWVLEIAGTPENLEMAHYVHSFVLEAATRLLSAHQGETGERGKRSAGRFLVGLMEGFDEKLRQSERQSREEGLVWVGDPGLGSYARARHPHVRSTRGPSFERDMHYSDGRRAGRDLVLHKPMSAKANRGRMLTG